MEEIGDEERRFVNSYIATGNMELAARGTIVDADAPAPLAKKTALQALGDTSVKAYFIDLMEGAGGSTQKVAETLVRLLDVKKYALHQLTGEKVEVGDDGMTQLGAVKIIMQGMGVLGGGPKVEPSGQNQAPVQVNVVFPSRNIRSEKEDVIIDGDDSYTARS